MYTYKVIESESLGEVFTYISRTDENNETVFIPMDETNSDYQAYLDKDKPKKKPTINEPTPES
jgi:hypothetical protein